MAFWPSPFIIAGGALRLLFCLVLHQQNYRFLPKQRPQFGAPSSLGKNQGSMSRRLHQDKGIAFWLSLYLFAGGALRLLFCLVLPSAKLRVLAKATPSIQRPSSLGKNQGSMSRHFSSNPIELPLLLCYNNLTNTAKEWAE